MTYVQARRPTSRRRATGGWSRSTSAPSCGCARDGKAVGTLRTERSFFPSADPALGPGLALLRGRGDERGRAARRAAPRRLERGRAERARPAHADRARATRCSPTPPTSCPPTEREIALGAGARRAHALLRGEPAARDVPADRLAAGELDLDRRADRVRGRADRALAARAARRRGRSRPATPRAWRKSSAARSLDVRAGPGGLRRRRARGRGAAAARPGGGGRGVGVGRARRSSRRPRRPSTPRSATPSSTTAPASSPRRTGGRRTARCAPRRSRSCGGSTRSRQTSNHRRRPGVCPEHEEDLRVLLRCCSLALALPARGDGQEAAHEAPQAPPHHVLKGSFKAVGADGAYTTRSSARRSSSTTASATS